MRRAAVLTLLGTLLAVAAPNASAVPVASCTPKTDGLPQALVMCDWDETNTELTVTGLAANGFASSFESEWTSDPVKMGPNTVMTAGGSIAFAQVLAGGIDRHLFFRFRLNNAKWTGWARAADVAEEIPAGSPGAGPSTAIAVPIGKLFYRFCKGCRLSVAVRYGGAHSGTVGFQETLTLKLA